MNLGPTKGLVANACFEWSTGEHRDRLASVRHRQVWPGPRVYDNHVNVSTGHGMLLSALPRRAVVLSSDMWSWAPAFSSYLMGTAVPVRSGSASR